MNYTECRLLLDYKRGQNIAIYSMVGTGGAFAKQNNSQEGRQMPDDFSRIWNIKKQSK